MVSRDTTARNVLKRLGIEAWLNTDGVTEVMINRPGEVFIEGPNGVERHEDERLSFNSLLELANTLAIFNNKHITAKDPMQSVTLPDGERCHIVMPPACETGTIVFSFRKPSKSRFTLDDYLNSGRLGGFADIKEAVVSTGGYVLADYEQQLLRYKEERNLGEFFKLAVAHKLNICMVGGTGSGKTTFTKAIADLVPPETRIVTIEDTHELSLPAHLNRVHLFYNEKITAKDIIATCMRLKPERIFLTELRGDEAWDYLSALNTGHPGGLTSVHANDAVSVFYRIAQLAKESPAGQGMDYDYILNIVRSTIDVVCFFDKTRLTELYYDPLQKAKAIRGK